ncbi:MAG TPA: hypothetical protein VMT66_03655 [Steroidobacteraceae bacterium]|nr:hypothetical protein [Steroidobacteraceae bacterium]
MINPTWTGVLNEAQSAPALPGPGPVLSRALKRAWGVACGVSFIAARGSIYLLVLPFTVLASLTGVALYAVQTLTGGHRG